MSLDFTVSPTVIDNIISDEEWLWQMLLNYLTNSVKYTEKGSITVSVSIRTEPAEDGISSDSNTRVSSFLLFEVADTGIGISEKN